MRCTLRRIDHQDRISENSTCDQGQKGKDQDTLLNETVAHIHDQPQPLRPEVGAFEVVRLTGSRAERACPTDFDDQATQVVPGIHLGASHGAKIH